MSTSHAVSTDHAAESQPQGSVKAYLVGFVLSIILTVIPFALVMQGLVSTTVILWTITACAVIQVYVHLVCFLHMGGHGQQRWHSLSFVFTVLIVAFLVGGSIWIMDNANSNMMPMAEKPTMSAYP